MRVIIARRILSQIVRTRCQGYKAVATRDPDHPYLTCPVSHRTSREHSIDPCGASCFHFDSSGARTAEWRDKLRDVWLHLFQKAGLSTSKEIPHLLLLDSEKRPDMKVHIGNRVVLLNVRTCALTTAGNKSGRRCAATPGFSAELRANSKRSDCYNSVPPNGLRLHFACDCDWRVPSRSD